MLDYLEPARKRPVPPNGNTLQPHYLVEPTSFSQYMLNNETRFAWKIKIIDFGQGSPDSFISIEYWN
jgi:hypothetical protein